jgi:YHS domain-containing protein
LLENNIWVRGTHEGGVIHRDRLYLCASPEERRRFLANPDLYAPALGGCDVVLAVDQNQLVQGHRKYGVRYEKDNRIYLFASQASSDRFAQDPGRYAAAVMRATASAAQRPAPPESPYGTSPGSAPGRRY